MLLFFCTIVGTLIVIYDMINISSAFEVSEYAIFSLGEGIYLVLAGYILSFIGTYRKIGQDKKNRISNISLE